MLQKTFYTFKIPDLPAELSFLRSPAFSMTLLKMKENVKKTNKNLLKQL